MPAISKQIRGEWRKRGCAVGAALATLVLIYVASIGYSTPVRLSVLRDSTVSSRLTDGRHRVRRDFDFVDASIRADLTSGCGWSYGSEDYVDHGYASAYDDGVWIVRVSPIDDDSTEVAISPSSGGFIDRLLRRWHSLRGCP